MANYHIDINGKAVICPAKIQCTKKGSDGQLAPHFEGSQQDADKWAEKKVTDEMGGNLGLNSQHSKASSGNNQSSIDISDDSINELNRQNKELQDNLQSLDNENSKPEMTASWERMQLITNTLKDNPAYEGSYNDWDSYQQNRYQQANRELRKTALNSARQHLYADEVLAFESESEADMRRSVAVLDLDGKGELNRHLSDDNGEMNQIAKDAMDLVSLNSRADSKHVDDTISGLQESRKQVIADGRKARSSMIANEVSYIGNKFRLSFGDARKGSRKEDRLDADTRRLEKVVDESRNARRGNDKTYQLIQAIKTKYKK